MPFGYIVKANMRAVDVGTKRSQNGRLRKTIMDGEWETASKLLTRSAPTKDHKKMLYYFYRQEYLELIERQVRESCEISLFPRLSPPILSGVPASIWVSDEAIKAIRGHRKRLYPIRVPGTLLSAHVQERTRHETLPGLGRSYSRTRELGGENLYFIGYVICRSFRRHRSAS